MFRKLISILFILLLFSGIAFASYQAKVTASSLNVRKNATTSSKVVFKLNRNEEITVYSCQNGFCEISVNDRMGFVSEKYIERIGKRTVPSGNKNITDVADMKGMLQISGALSLLILLMFVLRHYKISKKIFLFISLVAVACLLGGIITYGSLFLFYFIGVFIIAIIFIFYVKYRISPEGRQAAREAALERERRNEEREREVKIERREAEREKEREKEREDRERKRERERYEAAKKARQISAAYMRGSSAVVEFIDGNGISTGSRLISADEINGYTSSSVTVRCGRTLKIYTIRNGDFCQQYSRSL